MSGSSGRLTSTQGKVNRQLPATGRHDRPLPVRRRKKPTTITKAIPTRSVAEITLLWTSIMNATRSLGLLFLILVGAAAFYWFVTKPVLPLDRTLTNTQGKSLEVRIQGKDSVNLQVDRRADGERFEIPIQSLVWKDRIVAMRLPNEAAPPKVVVNEAPADPYIASRQKELAALREKRGLFIKELESQTLGAMLARKRRDDIISIEKEIRELEVAIEAYQYRQKEN